MPPPLGAVKEEVAVLVVLVRRHCCAVGAAVRRALWMMSAVEKKTGPATVRRMPPGLLDALPVHALGALSIVAVGKRADLTPPSLVVSGSISCTITFDLTCRFRFF